MKTKVLTKINSLIVFLLGLLGFYGCKDEQPTEKYGIPTAILDASGLVTDQEKKPLENIQVTVKQTWHRALPEQYSKEDGTYAVKDVYMFPEDSVDIIATDTAGVYASDSARVKVTYSQPDADWDKGVGTIQKDFQLKKNN